MNNLETINKANFLVSDNHNYDDKLKSKLNELSVYLSERISDGIIVAFSGGTDSAMLLWAVKKANDNIGGKLLAVTQDSYSLPRKDLDDTKSFVKSLNIEHEIVQGKEFDDQEYLKNDLNRCYHCKKELFNITDSIINRDGYKYVLYGYNSSDKTDFRPGHKAATERNVLSPLAELGFVKEEIREILRANNIQLAEKPATPCLSSRIMTGIEIDKNHLRNIEEMEKVLWNAGANIFRVRLCKEEKELFLRIEASEDDLQIVINKKDELVKMGKEFGYRWITLDLAGYKMGGGVM